MNLNLFFSDGTKEYRNPVDVRAGDNVTVRFRVPAAYPATPILHTGRGCIKMRLDETGRDRQLSRSSVRRGAGLRFAGTHQ